jgi:hypothetical protein
MLFPFILPAVGINETGKLSRAEVATADDSTFSVVSSKVLTFSTVHELCLCFP